MKKKFNIKALSLIILSALLLSLLSACTNVTADDLTQSITKERVDGKEADEAFINSNMRFSVELFKNVQKKYQGKNALVSPLSVISALALTANGAGGETLSQMEKLLGDNINLEDLNKYLYTYLQSLNSGDGFSLKNANSVWIKDDKDLTVNKGFLQAAADYYDSEIYKEVFDNSAINKINSWVNANTNQMIPKIVDKIDSDTVMYIINALAFDAEWNEVYEWNQVDNGKFTASDGKEQNVKMMSCSEYSYLEDENSTGFLKSYKGGKYSFAAILPNEGITVSQYVESMTNENLIKMLTECKGCKVVTKMPKFKYDFDLSLKETLQEMGLADGFDPNKADFSNMGKYTQSGDNLNLFISDVIHKTFIEVSEKGTRAGAAVSIEIGAKSAAPTDEIKYVILDRPFVYMIIDNQTKLPIFMGTVEKV